ncbi:PAS/PAC sensor-containing diguanylate cyclase/phosphodiesterase [Hyphomicrobium denitrificans 1NES1]|uniref:PAS/PAC sensor-containing diguanylate cyclase/phosphodiesterase n=1 Tax=Hyphomicrobium denitrificans 1NES1 TaxID=670307 RepID=N0B569_9HYPH|nr:bifunctional diguanylate cyclase/phosphodiesterase [Hyphomicrobium denitrificans]AGK58143.1 PAS/PAC sensor-containing diguanylate cyclase/phosphodiesterase [Hyphomicrobium denitrificans 1NES1]
MTAPFTARPLGNLGNLLIIGLCAAQGLLIYALTGVSNWAVLVAAAVICLSVSIAGLLFVRTNGVPGSTRQRGSYDETIEQFFYVLKSDRHGRLIDANTKYLARIGYTLQELSKLPRHRLRVGHYETSSLSEMWASVRVGKSWSGEFCDQAKDGSLVWMSAIVVPFWDAQGNLQSLTTVGVDITDKRHAEQALKEANSRLKAFIKHAPAAVAMFDKEMRYVAYTDRWLADYNLGTADLTGRCHYEVFPEIPEHWKRKHQRVLAGATEYCEEEKFVRADGRENIIRWEVRPWYLPDQSIGGMMMMTEEISERNKIRDKLWRLANLDVLTSLPNRLSFNELIHNEIQFSQSSNAQFAVALLDIDRLKEVNDTLGHDVGDQMLKQLASRLNDALSGVGKIARLGGDEFAVLIRGEDPEITAAFDVMREALEEPLAIGGTRRNCTVSVGVTKFPNDATTAGDLLKNADLALYRAKSDGRDRVVHFVPDMRSALRRRVELQQEARHALEAGQFILHFMPVVPIDPTKPVSFEALLRWEHPVHGLLAPGNFEEVLEDPRLAASVGSYVIEMAIRQAATWMSEGREFGRIAVNVLSADFSFGCLATRLQATLGRYHVPASKLCIEVTERVFLGASVTNVAETMHRINALGVEVALDDFGTGYASLTHLKAFPIDRLKIDRSFVQDMHENNNSLSIVQAIIQLGQSLGLRVTAEGVENYDQFVLLQSMGCGSFQGFYFSPPRSAEEISNFVAGDLAVRRPAAHALG